jgi:hypothetical protein
MRRVFKVAVLLIVLADVSLTASVPRASAQNGRTLRIGMTQEPATLDPIVGTLAVETDVDQLIYSGLTRYDEHGNLVPDLAEEVPTRANGGISSDGRVITYHLVHNARWQDGVPVTSADVRTGAPAREIRQRQPRRFQRRADRQRSVQVGRMASWQRNDLRGESPFLSGSPEDQTRRHSLLDERQYDDDRVALARTGRGLTSCSRGH